MDGTKPIFRTHSDVAAPWALTAVSQLAGPVLTRTDAAAATLNVAAIEADRDQCARHNLQASSVDPMFDSTLRNCSPAAAAQGCPPPPQSTKVPLVQGPNSGEPQCTHTVRWLNDWSAHLSCHCGSWRCACGVLQAVCEACSRRMAANCREHPTARPGQQHRHNSLKVTLAPR